MIKGIQNMNHCCFVNSSLQMLLKCEHYINQLKNCSSESKLYKEFFNFMNHYTLSTKYLFSADIQECLGFPYGHPNDCFEFLTKFMRVMPHSIPLYRIEFSENVENILESSSDIEIIICIQRVQNNKKIMEEYNLPFQCAGYQLKSFIIHEGNANFGHYVTIIIGSDTVWYCNDKNVEAITRQDAERLSKNCYICCYSMSL